MLIRPPGKCLIQYCAFISTSSKGMEPGLGQALERPNSKMTHEGGRKKRHAYWACHAAQLQIQPQIQIQIHPQILINIDVKQRYKYVLVCIFKLGVFTFMSKKLNNNFGEFVPPIIKYAYSHSARTFLYLILSHLFRVFQFLLVINIFDGGKSLDGDDTNRSVRNFGN